MRVFGGQTISLAALAWAALLVACSRPPAATDLRPAVDGSLDGVRKLEAGVVCAADELDRDADGDGLTNGEERCLDPSADADSDGVRNWQDWDSDNDRIPDKIEKGQQVGGECATSSNKRWPCDHDGDGIPDYLDTDSDNDGVLDQDEDPNGDGQLGCCVRSCHAPDPAWQGNNCALSSEGCGPGQSCVNGSCEPPRGFLCSAGETSPLLVDTFGDGVPDDQRGTSVCRYSAQPAGGGIRVLSSRTNVAGDWRIATETTARYVELSLVAPGAREAAALVDDDTPAINAAGFVLSRPTESADLSAEVQSFVAALGARLPGSSLLVRSPGELRKSHDRYDLVRGTTLDVTLTSPSAPSSIRNELVAAALGRSLLQLGTLPPSFGTSGDKLVVRLAAVRRFAFKRDPSGQQILDNTTSCAGKGCPVDDGDKSKWRLLLIGTVALRPDDDDPLQRTRDVGEDSSGGTALTMAVEGYSAVCEAHVIQDALGQVTLDRAPISASLTVALDNHAIKRSRVAGFEYDAGTNSILFSGAGATVGSHVLIGFERWSLNMCCTP
jgi:hypothetical protein